MALIKEKQYFVVITPFKAPGENRRVDEHWKQLLPGDYFGTKIKCPWRNSRTVGGKLEYKGVKVAIDLDEFFIYVNTKGRSLAEKGGLWIQADFSEIAKTRKQTFLNFRHVLLAHHVGIL